MVKLFWTCEYVRFWARSFRIQLRQKGLILSYLTNDQPTSGRKKASFLDRGFKGVFCMGWSGRGVRGWKEIF